MNDEQNFTADELPSNAFDQAMQEREAEAQQKAVDAIAKKVAHALVNANITARMIEGVTIDENGDIPFDRQFYSIGPCCEMFQVGPTDFRMLMKAAGVKFVQSVNDIGQIDANGLLQVSRFIREQAAAAEKN